MAGLDKQLGKYLLKSQLGHGGMGVVYLATDTRLHRDVALKILPRQMSADQEAVGRFMQEARVVAQLNHPNVVIVHDVDQERGYCYLVMELLTGGTMQDVLERGRLSWSEATGVIAQACRGLAAAQEAGLIHRDIKPSNIMKAANGIVKLTDFGLAKVVDEATNVKPMTKSGTVMGTPQFMSPEQCRGEPLDGRSDLYALGATYYTLLVGQPPFVDAQLLQVMFAHCSRPAPDPCSVRADIPTACGQIVRKALAKNRADRFASAQEMLAALDRILATLRTSALAPTKLAEPTAAIPGGRPELAATVKYPEPMLQAAPSADSASAGPRRPSFGRRGVALAAGAGAFLLLLIAVAGILFLWNPLRKTDADKVRPGEQQPIRLELRSELPVGNAAIRGTAFSSDSASLFSAALDGSVQEWDVASGKAKRSYAGTKLGTLAVAANPHWLAAGGHAKTLWLWKRNSDQPFAALPDHAGSISAIDFSPDGRRLAVGSYADVRLYELSEKGAKLLKVLGTSAGEPACYMVMSVAFSADSRWLAATTWTNKRVLLWNTANGELHRQSPELTDNPMAVAFMPGQDRLVIGLQYKGVSLWHWDRADIVPIRASVDKPARALAVSADGQTVVVAGEWGGTIRLFDLYADAEARVLPRSTGAAALVLALAPDGKLLAASGGDEHAGHGYLHLFDVTRGKKE